MQIQQKLARRREEEKARRDAERKAKAEAAQAAQLKAQAEAEAKAKAMVAGRRERRGITNPLSPLPAGAKAPKEVGAPFALAPPRRRHAPQGGGRPLWAPFGPLR